MVHLNLDFPEHFFDEEVRDGYKVSAEMKKVWAVELDLLNEFISVCNKHNIKFFVAGGTILGTVRHKGFVPWDDDIDIMMFRSEYDRLCKIASIEFKYPYFFQTEQSDSHSGRGHAQLRNSETTAILSNGYDIGRKINQGIFIDIFPLDFVPDDENEREIHLREVVRSQSLYRMWLRFSIHPGFDFRSNGIRHLVKLLGYYIVPQKLAERMYLKCYEKFERLSQIYNEKFTSCVVMVPFYNNRWIWKRQDLEDAVYLPFEMLTVPVPVNFDRVLKTTYGDWRKFIVGSSEHGGLFFDVEKSYKFYL